MASSRSEENVKLYYYTNYYITVTPPVGVIVEVNIYLRPRRSHVGNR